MAAVAIRLDDIHGRTPLELLHRLERELWRGKPVTYAAIPFAAPLCLGSSATAVERPGPRATVQHGQLVELLHAARHGGSDVALHGLNHADHKSAAGPAVPELVAISQPHAEALIRTLETWRDEFGTRVVIPPHNAIDADFARDLVSRGYIVNRSITDAEVTALGFDTTHSGRTMAKRIAPEHRPSSRSQFFQTVSVSDKFVRISGQTPEETAAVILSTAREAGNATLTLHWWDFARPASMPIWKYTATLLELLSPHVDFAPIGAFDGAARNRSLPGIDRDCAEKHR